MRAAIGVVLLIGAALLGAWSWHLMQPEAPPEVSSRSDELRGGVGMPRPDFRLRDVAGGHRSVQEWDGRVLVVNFWATWCPPCRSEMPRLIALQAEHADAVQVVGVALDDPELVAAYAESMGVNYPMLWGDQDAVDLAYDFGFDVIGLPITVIVDRQGTVRDIHIGEMFDQHIEELVLPLTEGP